jgi:hypothetical protein
MELICGNKYNLEKATAAANTCWAADVIYPPGHTYAKMALHLLDAIAPQETPRPRGSRQHSKDCSGAHTASVSPNRGSTTVKRIAPGTGRSKGEASISSPRLSTADQAIPLPRPRSIHGRGRRRRPRLSGQRKRQVALQQRVGAVRQTPQLTGESSPPLCLKCRKNR